jgi:chemotaxis protein CheC
MILTFDEHNGRALAAALLGKAPRDPSAPWTELEISAVNETGNILGCAYLNALTRLVAVELVPSPPYFIQDYAASVLDQALAPLAGECDVVTICRTNFRREGQDLNWNVLFIPTPGLRQALSEALHSNP